MKIDGTAFFSLPDEHGQFYKYIRKFQNRSYNKFTISQFSTRLNFFAQAPFLNISISKNFCLIIFNDVYLLVRKNHSFRIDFLNDPAKTRL